MATPANQRAVLFSQAVYRRLQLAYPRAHREAYGEPMEQLFRDQCRDAWQTARTWGLAKLWLRTLPDVISTSLLERFTRNNPGKNMNENLAHASRPGNAASLTLFFGVFAVVFLLIAIAGTAITFILPESYASTARIKMEREPDAAQNFDPYFLQTQLEIMQSEAVLTNVINALNLNIEWGKKFFGGEPLKTAETMEILKNRLSLRDVRGTKLVSITVYSDDKNEAAKLANAEAQCYADYRQNAAAEPLIKRLAQLQRQYKEQVDEIDRARTTASAHLDQLQAEHRLLYTQIEDNKLELQIPSAKLVMLIDTAEPGRRPVRPNKPLDIAITLAAGVIGGAVAGALAVLGLSFFSRRNA